MPTSLDTALFDYSSNRARFEQNIKSTNQQSQYDQHSQSNDQVVVVKRSFFSFLTDKLRKIKVHISG